MARGGGGGRDGAHSGVERHGLGDDVLGTGGGGGLHQGGVDGAGGQRSLAGGGGTLNVSGAGTRGDSLRKVS